MKLDDELFILTGKVSGKLQLDRNKELELFSLLNVASHNGTTLGQLEIAIDYFGDEFSKLKNFLESETYCSYQYKFGDKEDDE